MGTQKSQSKIRLQFQIDHAKSQRYKESPTLSFVDWLVALGSYFGYVGIAHLVLRIWQRYMKPFGLATDKWLCDDTERDIVRERNKKEIWKIAHRSDHGGS